MTVRKFGPVQCLQRKLKSFDQIIKNVLHRFSFQKSSTFSDKTVSQYIYTSLLAKKHSKI